MILITAETIIAILAFCYIVYLRTRINSLKNDIVKLKDESQMLQQFIRPK
jgi:cell division protein FtsL